VLAERGIVLEVCPSSNLNTGVLPNVGEVRRGIERLESGNVLVLENTRWERGETENDPALAEELAALAPTEMIAGYWRQVGATFDGGTRLA
jgi:hypothetical protein